MDAAFKAVICTKVNYGRSSRDGEPYEVEREVRIDTVQRGHELEVEDCAYSLATTCGTQHLNTHSGKRFQGP